MFNPYQRGLCINNSKPPLWTLKKISVQWFSSVKIWNFKTELRQVQTSLPQTILVKSVAPNWMLVGVWTVVSFPGRYTSLYWITSTQACCCSCCVALVVSDSVRPPRQQPTRLPVPRILQARTLEWVAISSSNAWKWKVKVKSLSHVRL